MQPAIKARGLRRDDRGMSKDCVGGSKAMSEETPSGVGFRQTPEAVEQLLSTVREALQMDVAFVSEFAEDRLVFRALEGDAESFG